MFQDAQKEITLSSHQKKAITAPTPQRSPLTICQIPPRQPQNVCNQMIWSDETKSELLAMSISATFNTAPPSQVL